MDNPQALIEQYLPLALEYGVKFVTALAIFFIGKWIVGIIANLIEKQLNKTSVDSMVSGFVRSILYWVMFAFVCIAALGQIGIQTASFVAIFGAAGLAVGLALQGSLSNFAAGVLIIIFKPFKIGDYVDAGGESGSINEIGIFSTELLTPDHKQIILPNSAIMGGGITNYSSQPHRRVDLSIGVGYEANLGEVKTILEGIIASEELVLKDKANMVVVAELADSSVNFALRAWVNNADYWTAYFNLTETVKLKLDEANISIPYPQMDVHISKES